MKNIKDRLPPQAIEVEESILASCLVIDHTEVVEFLRPEDFYRTAHKIIFEAICNLSEQGKPVDLLTVTNELRDAGKIEEVRGSAYVASLCETIPLAPNIAHYAGILRKKAILREAIKAGHRLVKACHDPGADPLEILTETQTALVDFESQVSSRTKFEVVCIEKIADVEIQDDPIIKGLLNKKESLILSAASGAGKSLFVSYLALALGNPPENGLWGLFQIPSEIKTLIIQSENGFNAFNKRLNKLFKACPEMRAGAKNVFTVKTGTDCRLAGSLTDKDFQKFLIDSLLSINAENLILDPLISYHGEDENDNAAMRRSLDCLSRVCDKANASVILCHHYNRQNLTRGAASIRDWACNMLLMDFEKKEHDSTILKITHDKSRNYEQQPDFYLERTPDLQFLRCEKPGKQSQQIESVITALKTMGGKVESQTALKTAVQMELNCSEATARRVINEALEMRKIIVVQGTGKGNPYGYELPK
jgi:replicative DNA helicase